MARGLRSALPVAVLALALTGCGDVQDYEVRAAAAGYTADVAAGDGAAACSALASATRARLEESTGDGCARAVLEEAVTDPGAVRGIDVFGTAAQVRLERDTLFLARSGDGWRIVAAACAHRRDRPYDCAIEGG